MNKGPLIVNRYDLSVVQEKVQNSNYKSTLEFLNDIRLIQHNAEILFGSKCRFYWIGSFRFILKIRPK